MKRAEGTFGRVTLRGKGVSEGAESFQLRHEAWQERGARAMLAELTLKKCFTIYLYF